MRWIDAPDADVESVALSGDGRYLAWMVNEEGFSALKVRDLRSDRDVALPEIPKGVIDALAISRSGGKVGFLMAGATHPNEVYVLDLERSTLTRLTESMLGGIDEADLTAPELIRYPTHDGREIPAWLYRPAGRRAVPGDPFDPRRPGVAGTADLQLRRALPVPADPGDRCPGAERARLDRLRQELPEAHPPRLGRRRTERFKAAARLLRGLRLGRPGTHRRVRRLVRRVRHAFLRDPPARLLGGGGGYRRALEPGHLRQSGAPHLAALHGPVGRRPRHRGDFLLERSPITYVDQIKAPLFVIQGANDPRVVQDESDQIVERLRARGSRCNTTCTRTRATASRGGRTRSRCLGERGVL